MTKIPERFLWATQLLSIKQTHQILEIGCGAGLLAEQIANKLKSGQLIAIDKSLPMIEKAKQRNKKLIANGTAKFIASGFIKSSLPNSYFDSIVAFNVNFFWRSPHKELQMIGQLIKPKGKVYIFYQAPFEMDINSAEPIREELEKNEFDIIDTQIKKFVPTSAICITAKRNYKKAKAKGKV